MGLVLYFICCFHYDLSPQCIHSPVYCFYMGLTMSLILGSSCFHATVPLCLVFISLSCFHHAATQNPGHSTKLVTLPSSSFYDSSTLGQSFTM